MCSVFVNINIINFFSINITCKMLSLVDNKTFLSLFMCFMCKNRTKQSRTYY